jgi:hypothetical protein
MRIWRSISRLKAGIVSPATSGCKFIFVVMKDDKDRERWGPDVEVMLRQSGYAVDRRDGSPFMVEKERRWNEAEENGH